MSSISLPSDMIVHMFTAFLASQRKIHSAKVISGLKRAKRNGVKLGRPVVVLDKEALLHDMEQGMSMRNLAKKYGVGVATIYRNIKPRTPRADDHLCTRPTCHH